MTIVCEYIYVCRSKHKPRIWFFELSKNFSWCHCTMSFATASRHHQTSFTRVSTICTMAHLKRVSKSRGNADAAITQLNYNMPFNNLAPSYASNRNLIAFSRCFSFGFAFSANQNRKRKPAKYRWGFVSVPLPKTCFNALKKNKNKKINLQQQQQQSREMKIYFRFLIEANS